MIGYNQPRPKEEQYTEFIHKIIKGLKKLKQEGLCLMIHGSYVRGDYIPGRSDIDSTMILPNDVVTDKKLMRGIAHATHIALKGNNVEFQVTPLDTTTMRDGRFNSYTHEFMAYFNTEGKILVGPDYRPQMKCLESKVGEMSTLSHNLRKVRMGLIFAEKNMKEDYEEYLKQFMSTLKATSRGSKQVLFLADGGLRKNRFSALKELPKKFPEVNSGPLEEIKYYFDKPHRLDILFKSGEGVLKLQEESVTMLEEIIRAYIRRNPIKIKKKTKSL
ncbi:MAG: nucleotidyltransferase domain-containing protein [archaeon]